ncbi:MAG: hypothetical protein MJZ66_01040 [Bacteroidales bacterium]|nr:hypothetical protein [Bacteroidales bacterium]
MSAVKELFKIGGQPNLSKSTSSIITVSGIFLILALWQLVCSLGLIPDKILPSPLAVITSYGSLFSEYDALPNAWYSIKLNLLAYFWAILISLPFGFFISLYPINNMIIGKYINSIRYLPIPAMSGIFIAIFGLTFGMKTSFLTFSLLIYILPAVANKVNDLQNPTNDKDFVYLQTIQTLGATQWQKFRYVYFPYVTRNISQEIITLTGISWSYIVIVEMLYKDGAVSGIGALIQTMTRMSKMPEVYALLILVIVIGILQDILLKYLDKLIFPSKYNRKRLF